MTSFELYFIYDSHCPWSYAATPLVEHLAKALPNGKIHMWHSAYFQGDIKVNGQQLDQVIALSQVKVSAQYRAQLDQAKDSVLVANLFAWLSRKAPQHMLALLKAVQIAHFQQGIAFDQPEQLAELLQQFKLSPPAKVLNADKLSKDAEFILHEVFEMQELINTQAIPALLLAIENDLILLNHNLYLNSPASICEAVNLELAKR